MKGSNQVTFVDDQAMVCQRLSFSMSKPIRRSWGGGRWGRGNTGTLAKKPEVILMGIRMHLRLITNYHYLSRKHSRFRARYFGHFSCLSRTLE